MDMIQPSTSHALLPDINPWCIPFEMTAAPGARLALLNERMQCELDEAAIIPRFAWLASGKAAGPGRPTRTFYADRYGGIGTGRNGGGARCAADGLWQVKGIGLNPLAGVDNEGRFERPGTTALAECVLEMVWSEIFHHALPYGSTRVRAVIATGVPGSPDAAPAAQVLGLSVREAAWRPAHFQRAVYFRPAAGLAGLTPRDADRVCAAIARLPALLAALGGTAASGLADMTPRERIVTGLVEMTRRFAEQMAAAATKRLMHGTLTASNICLDGRWIDFSTASALPGYASRIIRFPNVLEEYRALREPLAELGYYIGKYHPDAAGVARNCMPGAGALVNTYELQYADALARRFTGLCGYPPVMTDTLWRSSAGRQSMQWLAQVVEKIARSGMRLRYGTVNYPDRSVQDGRYDLLGIIATLPPAQRHPSELERLLPETALRNELAAAHSWVLQGMRTVAGELGLDERAFWRMVRLLRMRSARNNPLLYRGTMNLQVDQLVLDHPDIDDFRAHAGALLDEVADQARLLYEDSADCTVLLWVQDDSEVRYDAARNDWQVCQAGRKSRLAWDAVFDHAAGLAAAPIRAMRAYWGDALCVTL
jgi:hypothetical protein